MTMEKGAEGRKVGRESWRLCFTCFSLEVNMCHEMDEKVT